MSDFISTMEQDSPRYVDCNSELHLLHDNWVLWAHMPHDTDWSMKSYKKISEVKSVEEAIALCETIPDKMIRNCMLFLMREGIHPTWEDSKNINGGSFSYKINNKYVPETWKMLFFLRAQIMLQQYCWKESLVHLDVLSIHQCIGKK